MKKIILFALAFLATFPLAAQQLTVSVENPSKEIRTDVPVVIALDRYDTGEDFHPIVKAHIINGNRPELIQEIPCQLSGKELVFLADVKARSTATYSVDLQGGEPTYDYAERVHAQLKLWDRKYRYPRINEIEFQGDVDPRAMYDAIYGHGAMWESEYVGFRVYMDNRQSIDLYGKKHPQMELDTVNFYSNRDFLAAGYGEDILWAGQSIGAGSFRGLTDGQPVYIDKVKARGQRVVDAGPLRTIVEVWDRDWEINGRKLQMLQRYTMFGGHRDVMVDIFLRDEKVDISEVDKLVFATGSQKLEQDNEGMMQKDGLVGSWGRNVPDKNAPDLIEGLGIGVYAEPQYVEKVLEDDLNYLVHLHPVGGHIRYHLSVAADMQLEGGYHDAKAWFGHLKEWQQALQTPCKITIR